MSKQNVQKIVKPYVEAYLELLYDEREILGWSWRRVDKVRVLEIRYAPVVYGDSEYLATLQRQRQLDPSHFPKTIPITRNIDESTRRNSLYKMLYFLEMHPEIVKFLKDKIRTIEEKKAFLDNLLTQMECDSKTKKFVSLIIDRGRGEFLPLIASQAFKRMLSDEGHLSVEIITARVLLPQQLKRIKLFLKKQCLDPEVKIFLKQTINEEILGGVQIRLGSALFDKSLKTQVTNLKNFLDTTLLN